MDPTGLRSSKLAQKSPHSARRTVPVARSLTATQKAISTAGQRLQSSIAVPDALTVSPHPDAVRRRAEYAERRRAQEELRRQAARAAQQGLRWFEASPSCPANMHMAESPEHFKQLIAQAQQEGKLLVAKFFTEDCWVCKSLHPKLKSIASDNPDVMWVKLNGSDPGMVPMFQALGVTKVPLFHMVREGELVSELTASLNPERLARFRAELAANKPTAVPAVESAAAAAAAAESTAATVAA